MRINIFKRTPPAEIRQGSAIRGQVAGADFDPIGMWGLVTQTNSEHVTADVRLRSGVELRDLKVRSLEWSGYNADRAFGERDLPPAGSKVFVLFPEGMAGNEDPFILCSVIDTVWEVGEKAKEELAVGNLEREFLRILEAGWKLKYDKDTGDLTIETSDETDKIIITVDRTNRKAKLSIGNIYFEVTNAQVNIAGNTKSLVMYSDLDSALQNLITALNDHVHTGVTTGGGSSGPPGTSLSLDISAAEAQKAKTE